MPKLIRAAPRMIRFTTTLLRGEGKGAWTFAPVPPDLAPPVTGPFGMTPVVARLDGRQWSTTVWRDRRHGALLPCPRKVRGGKEAGDTVEIELDVDWLRDGDG